MKIESVKELQKLISMLQAHGVELYKNDGLELVLRPMPEKQKTRKTAKAIVDNFGEVNESTQIPIPKIENPDDFDSLTDEQKLFYSSAPGGQTSGPSN